MRRPSIGLVIGKIASGWAISQPFAILP